MQRLCLVLIFLGLLFIRPFISSLAFPDKDLAHCGAFIITSLLLIRYKRTPLGFLDPKIIIRLLLFLILIIFAVCLSSNINKSLLELPHYLSMILCFLAVYSLNESETHIFIFTIILSACIVSLQATTWVLSGASWLLNFLSDKNIRYLFAEEVLSRNRAFLPFLLPATLGGYLIMHLPLGITFFLQHYKNVNIPFWKRPPKNSFLLCAVILMLIALFLTKSIGPIISLLLGTLIVLFLHKSSGQKTLKFIICFLAAILFMVILVRSCETWYWRNPIYSLAQRHIYWANTIAIIKAHPFLGIGPGNMPFVGSKFSHNSYLQIWAESGPFALFGFLNILFYALGKNLDNKIPPQPLAISLWISVLGFLLHNLIDFTFFLPETAVIWWGIFALFCRKHPESSA
ncbi:MAG: O-antigen ligase family protein [Candidatus Omnitrophica bacterium]|nr:O-antigen ligase family protein [Candidatus Omnitrophota bacterium]